MAQTIKSAVQSYPNPNALTDAYTVGAGKTATVSTIAVCNQSNITSAFCISIAVAGAADTPAQYIYFNMPIQGNDTYCATIGVTLTETDVVRVLSQNGYCSFNIFAIEVS